MDWGILWGAAGLFAGGILKGAVGAGAPILAMPLLALIYNVPLAVAILTLPNLSSNMWQAWSYRANAAPPRFVLTLASAGVLGVLAGSAVLVTLPGDVLLGVLACFVFIYIAVRLGRPDWILSRLVAERLAAPAGFAAGLMQGAGGMSAPVSVTFLSAMRLERLEFVATISVFFAAITLVQVPTLWVLGVLTPKLTLLSALAAVPLFAGIPVGAWLARYVSRETFDKLILVLLGVIALRLLWAAIA